MDLLKEFEKGRGRHSASTNDKLPADCQILMC